MTEQIILTPIEAINEFYSLKNKYENSYYEKYVKPILKSNKSKREKRVDFSRLPKHECINCKRNVGTLFNIKTILKESIKKYTVKCGDLEDPCPLDIEIDYSLRIHIHKEIIDGLKSIEQIKLDIIKQKNNAIFFINKNIVSVFEELTNKLKVETENTGFSIETNILRNDNPEQKILLKKMIDEFGKGFILPFKEMIKQYDDTNNEIILNTALKFYIDEMIPKLQEIQQLKYDINIVEFDETNNIYKLIQLPNSLESNEYFIKDDDKVINFIRGLRKEKKKTRKEQIQIKPKNKTKKIKPIADLVLEDEEEIVDMSSKESREQIAQETPVKDIALESKFGQEMSLTPIFDELGNVTWNNEEYNNLWKKIPLKLKELFKDDRDWLIDYMNTCVKLSKNGKPCKVFLPKQTTFPPVLLENGEYDFNSEIVNKLFNGLEKSYQNTLLTFYSTKDGVKNYDMLKDTLENILSKQLNFERGYF